VQAGCVVGEALDAVVVVVVCLVVVLGVVDGCCDDADDFVGFA
jgi:hypothetical protein